MSYKNMNLSDKKTKTFVNCLCNYFGSGESTFDIFVIFFDKSTKLFILAREGA